MKKPLIGVSAGYTYTESGTQIAQVSSFNTRGVELAGGVAVIVAPHPDCAEDLADALDGLLLTGGGDVNPAFYGEAMNGSGEITAARDEYEMALCKAMIARKKPILGICRGIQVLNVAMGGTLVQDIPSQTGIQHPYGTLHPAWLNPDSFLGEKLGGDHMVNSTHHQCVKDLAPGMRIVATSENGRIPEAIQAEDGRPFYGVQWHPERLLDTDPDMLRIFEMLTK